MFQMTSDTPLLTLLSEGGLPTLPLSYAGALYEDRIYNLSFKCQAKIYKKIKKYGAEMLIVTSQSKRTG